MHEIVYLKKHSDYIILIGSLLKENVCILEYKKDFFITVGIKIIDYYLDYS